jgi:hypothetical protein
MDWFMAGIARGSFDVKNPYNRLFYRVPASVEDVHTIVFWSKNFSSFLQGNYGDKLLTMGYNLFFNFTLNSANHLIEPCIPSTGERLEQVEKLCSRFGPRTVQWRFDPICFYQTGTGKDENNLGEFEAIARFLAQRGVSRCVTSFMDFYAKIGRRPLPVPDFKWVEPPLEKKIEVISHMGKVLKDLGINFYLCCEKQVYDSLCPDVGVLPGQCIPNRYLVEIFGGRLSFQKDAGQRRQKGCGCMASKDIGGYDDQPCFHNCLYCYANPSYRKAYES